MNIHLKTASGYIKRSPFQAFAAILVLALTFFVITLLSLVVYSSTQVLSYFETRPQIIAFLKSSAKPEEISNLQHSLAERSELKEIRYVTKEEALSIYKKATADNPLLGELVNPSIFPASLEFSVKDLSVANSVIEEVKKEPIVDSVGFTASLGGQSSLGNVVDRLKTVVFYLRAGLGVLSGILAICSFFVLLVVIGMRLMARRDEVEILKLIGATPGFIRSPIILEAVFYSLAGVFIGWVMVFIGVLYAAPTILGYFGEIPVLPRETVAFFSLFGTILLGEVFFSLLLALSGSILAISRVKNNR